MAAQIAFSALLLGITFTGAGAALAEPQPAARPPIPRAPRRGRPDDATTVAAPVPRALSVSTRDRDLAGVEVAEVARVRFPEGRGLDLGCGDGRLTRVLTEQARRPMRLVGLDVDPQETSLAPGRAPLRARAYLVGRVIPEPDASFDFVMSISVMEHIAEI